MIASSGKVICSGEVFGKVRDDHESLHQARCQLHSVHRVIDAAGEKLLSYVEVFKVCCCSL